MDQVYMAKLNVSAYIDYIATKESYMSIDPKIVLVKKASGHTEAFDSKKLMKSLRNAGAEPEAITEVVTEIEDWVSDGVTTSQIYTRAFKLYRQISSSGAVLYKLKQAILEMGPSGFPFEHFVGEIFKRRAYDVKVGQIIEGASVSHEVDIIARKDRELILGECKYSHKQGFSVSVQVPLYVHSRVNDIVDKLKKEPQYKGFTFVPWLFTNGRFTPDSTQYSHCKGIKLMGWDYPVGQSLKDQIERERIFPITILSNLTKSQKSALLTEGVVTCSQLMDQPAWLERLGLDKARKAVLKELESLADVSKL